MGYECANPFCESGMDVETHHIVPIKQNGADKYWNFIRLCFDCHRHSHIHSRYEDTSTELYTWKCMQELELLGFIMDENEINFTDNYRKILRERIRENM